MEVTWKHGSGSRRGSGLQIFLEAEAEAKVHRFHKTDFLSFAQFSRFMKHSKS